MNRLRLTLVAVFAMSLMVGCGTSPGSTQAPPLKQLVVAENSEPTTLDPLFQTTLSEANLEWGGIFNALDAFTPSGGFTGALASSWSVSSSHTMWTFKLRPHVTWQDGKPFSSSDVAFTFDVALNPATGAFIPPILKAQIQSVSANGPNEVSITLKHPLPASLFLQAISYVPIVPQHILGSVPPSQLSADTQFNQHPIGTGPLMLTNWVQGDYLKFRANPRYFLGAPHIKNVVVDIIPSPTTAVAQLETGAVDLVDASTPLTPSQYQAAAKHSNVTGYTNTNLSWKNITLSEMGLFRDIYVRQALDYATPKRQLIKSILNGYATPAYYSQPQTSWQGTMTGVHEYPFSLSKAKNLLTAHGFHMANGVMTLGGQKLDVTLYASSTDPQNQLIARVLQQDWGKIGVQVHIRLVDPNALFAAGGPLFAKSGLNAFLFSWQQGPDPESDAYHWLSSNSVTVNPSGGNYARFQNATVDKLLTQGALTFSQQARAHLYHQVDRILSAQVPDIFLWWSSSLTLANSHLTGYHPNAYNFATFWNFQTWRWK